MFTGAGRTMISAHYFVYFGTLGVFLPFFNLYCYNIGFTGTQIGVLSGARSLTLMIFPVLWGMVADRYHARRPIYIVCVLSSTMIWGLYLLTDDFSHMLWISVGYGFFFAPLISFLEAFTMDVLDGRRNTYGRIRAWGSLSFIATVLVLGPVFDQWSIRLVLWLILAGSGLQVLLSLALPKTAAPPVRQRAAGVYRRLLQGRVVGFWLCAFLMLVSHGAYYGFFSIHLEKLGYDRTFIGACWALASTAEIAVMLQSEKIFSRFSYQRVLVFSFLTATARWLLLYFFSSAGLLLASQLLHAVTYGAFHMASILYVDATAPAETKTVAQAANNAITYGAGLMVGFLLGGWLYERWEGPLLFLTSAGIALAAGLLLPFVLRASQSPRVGKSK